MDNNPASNAIARLSSDMLEAALRDGLPATAQAAAEQYTAAHAGWQAAGQPYSPHADMKPDEPWQAARSACIAASRARQAMQACAGLTETEIARLIREEAALRGR